MLVAVDGTFYRTKYVGGIARIYNEIMPRMADLDPAVQFTLYIKPPYNRQLPEHAHIRRINLSGHNWRPARIRHRLSPTLDSLMIRATLPATAIWHSANLVLPPRRVKAVLASFYDATYFRSAHLLNAPDSDAVREKQRRVLHAADLVCCNSQATADDATELLGIPASKLRVVKLAPDPLFRVLHDIDKMAVPPPTAKPFLLYVGGRRFYKNFEALLVQYSRWPRTHDFDLVVVGQGWSDAERYQIETLGITDHVHLLKNIDDQQLCQMYNQAAVFAFSSLAEGFGLPPLEAMACGCPVVAASIPVTHEVCGSIPFYFDPTQNESIMPAVDAAINHGRDPGRVAAGQAQAASYSWDKTARETLALYRSML